MWQKKNNKDDFPVLKCFVVYKGLLKDNGDNVKTMRKGRQYLKINVKKGKDNQM